MVDKETLDRCLEGISFPADGGTIADHASFNGCPSDVVAAIRKLSEQTFRSEDEVFCSRGESTYC